MILVPMVEEKGCGVKEFLRIASAQSYLNNVTFFFTNLFIGCIIFGLTLIVAACYQLLAHVVTIWLIILLFLYLTSAIAFTFLLTVAFDSGKMNYSAFLSFTNYSFSQIPKVRSVLHSISLFWFHSLLCKNRWFSMLHCAILDCAVQRKNARFDTASFQFGGAAERAEFTRHLWHERSGFLVWIPLGSIEWIFHARTLRISIGPYIWLQFTVLLFVARISGSMWHTKTILLPADAILLLQWFESECIRTW